MFLGSLGSEDRDERREEADVREAYSGREWMRVRMAVRRYGFSSMERKECFESVGEVLRALRSWRSMRIS